jgi:hypothetical protein
VNASAAWATLAWPAEATLLHDSGSGGMLPIHSGGMPCLPEFRHCTAPTPLPRRHDKTTSFNEKVDGALRAAQEFNVLSVGTGVYGIGLVPTNLGSQHENVVVRGLDLPISATLSVGARSCAPGYVPMRVLSLESQLEDAISWRSADGTWYGRCVQPAVLPVNRPTRVRPPPLQGSTQCQGRRANIFQNIYEVY